MKGLANPVVGALLATVLLTAVFLLSETGVGLLEIAERWTLDARFRLRGAQPAGPDVALVVLDDATATRAGPLMERRSGVAKVLRAVKAAGAKVIGVDAVFDVPERLVSDELKARVNAWTQAHPPDERDEAGQLLGQVGSELEGDAELAQAMRDAGNVVLILHASFGAEQELELSALGRAKYTQSTVRSPPPPEISALSTSLPLFNAASKAQGFASVSEDESRTVRRLAMARGYRGSVYFPFVVPVVAAFRDVNRARLAYLGPEQELALGDARVPLQDDFLWLNYRGPERTFPTWSAVELLEGKVPPGSLVGKVVLIGITRLGYDVARTPFEYLPGVEVQATAIDNVLRGDWLRRSPRRVDAAIMLSLGALAALLFLSRRLGPREHLLGLVVLAVTWLGFAHSMLSSARLWVPLVGPLVTLGAAGVAGLSLSYAGEALARRQLKQTFGRYLGAEALDALLSNPGSLRLGGERRTLTVLFSDIRDFTTLSEKLDPEKLVAVLNAYLSPMTRAVLAQGGLLDKYIGDAVMAVFGAPIPRADHARQALACVLEMHEELTALNAGALAALEVRIDIGVGLNSGEMVVGNMGSEERYDYTVVGDAVNLASRLEGLTKRYGVFCLVGGGTVALAGQGFTFRELDLVQVKGKHEAVPIGELLSGPGHVVRALAELPRWDAAIAAWRKGALSEARAHFEAFAQANPGDRPAALYLERLAGLPAVAPEGWTPVAIFTSK